LLTVRIRLKTKDAGQGMADRLTFILNGRRETVASLPPTTTLLAYLRGTKTAFLGDPTNAGSDSLFSQSFFPKPGTPLLATLPRRLTGTKEGCAEGDCGACTVAVGELGRDGIKYRAVNACIQFLPMLHGKAVVTVEGLKGPGGALHPCQQAIVDRHGSQCGFCTPGFVMSLYAMGLNGASPELAAINDEFAGNLCRCTGYGPLIEAARDALGAEPPAWDRERRSAEAEALAAINRGETLALTHDGQRYFAPTTADEFAAIYLANPDAVIVAGATDVGLWVTKQHRDLRTLISIAGVEELRAISIRSDTIHIGAAATYSDAEAVPADAFPDFGELIRRLGARQVRNAGTIGGNIANGSPIGDTPPALIALGATIHLRQGETRRRMPLEDFFIAYGRQDRAPGEFVEAVEVPLLRHPEQLRCYKITKRFDQDISAVCGCFSIRIEAGVAAEARIAFGGMAATPKRARTVEAALIGRPWAEATIKAALPAFEEDFAPLTDMRGSATYRMLTAKNLLRKYFAETRLPLSQTRLAGRGAEVA
jgi:xanthine dehydrogenase small subunit